MSRTFFNRQAGVWDDEFCEQDCSKLGGMVSRLHIRLGDKVLDIGSGTGIFLPFLKGMVGDSGQIVALDYAEEMLKKAAAKRLGSNVSYVQADVTWLPFASCTFDSIVCYSCFPHFGDKAQALAEMGRVVRPGGWLYVCHTSSRLQINEFHRRIESVKQDCLPESDVMRRIVIAAGFATVSIDDGTDSYLLAAHKDNNG